MIDGLDPNLPIRPGANYVSNSGASGNTAVQIVAPGSNVNGMIIWRGTFMSGNGTGVPYAAFLAKASAPAGVSDGVGLITPDLCSQGVSFFSTGKLERPRFVPAGLGVYFITSISEAVSYRALDYTLM